MGLVSLEHGSTAYRADFALYGLAVAALGISLVTASPAGHGTMLAATAAAGLAAWTLIEYALHRFVLHGVQPFEGWHTAHHRRPLALICTPTVLSAALVALLVVLPAWWVAGAWSALALTFGVLGGYLGYAITHHATHHWKATSPWLRARKRWHARHHSRGGACFGVTSGVWDHVFGTA